MILLAKISMYNIDKITEIYILELIKNAEEKRKIQSKKDPYMGNDNVNGCYHVKCICID